jgi:serine/threonine-protein kinase
MLVCAACQGSFEQGARFCPHCGQPCIGERRGFGPGSELEVQGLGRAVLGHAIGEGGMGIVYRAWLYYDPNGPARDVPPHPVAVKVLSPFFRGRERARKLFQREAEALRRLSHPNIVHFLALSEQGDQTAIVMELVQGEALSSLLARAIASRPSPSAPAVPFLLAWHYFAQLLGALAAVHEIGILHRDVKPANVIARADGVIKLTDFGIARLPSTDAAHTGGMAAGTGAYMSPEAVRGETQDARADLYSAGIVLDALFARALAKDPPHRYGSAIELGEAFRTALGAPPGPGWLFQQELARLAKTVSGLELPAVPATEPDPAERAAELREELVSAFQHPGTEPE